VKAFSRNPYLGGVAGCTSFQERLLFNDQLSKASMISKGAHLLEFYIFIFKIDFTVTINVIS